MNGGVVLNKIATSPSPSPSFLNQYSYNFDGVNDYVDCGTSIGDSLGDNYTGDLSMSMWFKWDNAGAQEALFEIGNRSSVRIFYLSTYLTKMYWQLGTSGAWSKQVLFNDTTSWHHVLLTYKAGDATNSKFYLDGIEVDVGTGTGSFPVAADMDFAGLFTTIGQLSNTINWTGNIDEVAIFNTDQSANVAEIYNGGVPKDLTDLSPMTWWRMGENATWRDPQWLLPSNENKDKVSNYSMTFDGVNDVMTIGTIDFTNPFTVSLWVKWVANDIIDNTAGIIQFDKGSQVYSFAIGTGLGSSNDTIGVSWNNNHITFGSGYGDDAWHNIVVKGDGVNLSGVIYYIDGVDVTSIGTPVSNLGLQSTTSYVGKNTYAGDRYFKGNIDEISLWDKELSVSDAVDIYNGGTPTTITGAVAHYRMGEDAIFDGSNWTIPDIVGSSTGTTANMDISDRVGDAPNSINNVLSLNMVEVDRETDVPPTFNFKSLLFDGVDDYLSVGATFDATNGVSFSCWVKYDGVGAGLNWLCSNGNTSGVESQFNTRLISDGRWFNYFQGSARDTGITGLNDGNWHNLIQTVNYSNGDVKFYKDGAVSVTVLTFGSDYSTAKLGGIGGATSTPLYPFKGLVDEFAIFESVLTPAEIVTLSTAPTVDLTSLNPAAWYRMGDNDTFPTITDNGSGGFDGTMINMDAGDIVSDTP
jgi:hypothetical protein